MGMGDLFFLTFGFKDGMCDSQNKRAGHPDTENIQPFRVLAGYVGVDLALADSEHLSPTYRAYALGCRLPILHGYCPRILHFPLGPAFHAVCLHLFSSLLYLH